MTDLATAHECPPVSFEMTEAHMRRLMEISARASFKTDAPPVPAKTRLWAGLTAVACLFATVLLLAGAAGPRVPSVFALLTLGVGCAAATKLVDNRPKRRAAAKRWVNGIMRSTMTAKMLGAHTLRVTAEGVEYHTPIDRKETLWPGLHYFAVHDGYVVVALYSHGVYVPQDAFAEVGGAEAFVDFGNRRLFEEGVGTAQAMIAYLAGHDVPCKACRYNLRGTTSLACPECARPIAWDDVPGAWTRASEPPRIDRTNKNCDGSSNRRP